MTGRVKPTIWKPTIQAAVVEWFRDPCVPFPAEEADDLLAKYLKHVKASEPKEADIIRGILDDAGIEINDQVANPFWYRRR